MDTRQTAIQVQSLQAYEQRVYALHAKAAACLRRSYQGMDQSADLLNRANRRIMETVYLLARLKVEA